MRINWYKVFETSAKAEPERVVIKDGERTLAFADVLVRETELAKKLVGLIGEVRCRPIAVFLPKCAETIIADTAIIHTGNAYMNMDVKTPPERLTNVLKTAQPLLVITDEAHKKNIVQAAEGVVRVVTLEEFAAMPDVDANLDERLRHMIDTDPFCLINTSGSTGTPKGVVLNHRSFFDFLDCAKETWNLTGHEVIGSLSPVIFDIYSFELCMLYMNRATMVLIPDTWAMFPVKILELLEKEKVSFIFWVPTIMVNIANMGLLDKFALNALKMIWYAGEVFPTKQFNVWYKKLAPRTRFMNLYGPIEITLDCTWFEIKRDIPDSEPIPIGFACENTDILVLNADNKLVQGQEEGELCVRGTSLAMGYYNNPEKTALAFTQNPLNTAYPELIYRTGDIVYYNERGEIVFKGRKDSLIKHSGYRIELTEIEHVIVNTLKLVDNGCVVYNFKAKEITLFYEAAEELNLALVRRQIAAALPKYMIPSVFIREAELPRGGTGKIDRALLNKRING